MGRRSSVSDEYYAEPAADEIYSGPTHDLLPSSYSSFHIHHNVSRRDSEHSEVSRQNEEDDSDDDARSLISAWREHRRPSEGGFSFFSREEVQQAEGSSTAMSSDSDDGFSDEEDDYGHNRRHSHGHLHASSHMHRRRRRSMASHLSEPSRRSHSPSHSVEEHSLYEFSDSEPLLDQDADRSEFVYANAKRQQQRYFIAEEDLKIVCAGYRRVRWRRYVYYAACWLSLGVAYLLLRWFPRWRIQWLARACPLGKCDCVVIENQWGDLDIVDVQARRYNQPLSTVFCHHEDDESDGDDDGSGEGEEEYVDEDPNLPVLRTMTYRFLRFHYNPKRDLYLTNTGWRSPHWATHEGALEGLEADNQALRETVFGLNSLEIPCPSTVQLLMAEVLHPFYIFQVFSIVLWAFDHFLYYATAIFIVSVASIVEALYETRSNLRRLRDMIAVDQSVRVLRSGFWNTIKSSELLPGDVFELSDPDLMTLPCDAILLSGDCIVNESILTGESVPVSKVAANDESLTAYVDRDFAGVASSFLYGGTKLIRARKPNATTDDLFSGALAMTVKTGFTTTQGSLVRSMLFPKPTTFSFYRDSFYYIGVMAIIAIIGFIISLVSFVEMELPLELIITRALDLITIVVPPALPATLTIGTNISLARLRKKQIFCITPSRTNIGGRIDFVAFDKTGTLTEDGLDVMGVHTFDGKFSDLITTPEVLKNTPMLDILASCHELRSVDGELLGDPLDIKMFEFSKFHFSESEFTGSRSTTSPDGQRRLNVAKQFEFISKLRRMSVVASVAHGDSSVLLKGAPEVMRQVCAASSIPESFDSLYHEYTHRGYRVIACAYKQLVDLVSYDREQVEQELIFCGFIVFENRLKPTTRGVINSLARAEIRTAMCTGDNLLTAISVARECHIVEPQALVYAAHFVLDELRWECVDDSSLTLDSRTLIPQTAVGDYCLAISGEVFGFLRQTGSQSQIEQMLLKGAVYARMSPDEKHELVAGLQAIDYTVCFCGDGANDVGALKEAQIGISLSEAEASIAAPFTSRIFEISCVLDVIKEGRCALQTSFSCFQFMSLYSAIQFFSVTMLYGYGSNLGDFQYLWIDLFLIVPLAMFMAWSKPAPNLCTRRPKAKLVSRRVLVPLVGAAIIFGTFQYAAVQFGHKQPWYQAPEPGNDSNLRSTDNMALFLSSNFQYIMAAVLLCRGMPYRMPVYTNKPFIATVIVCTAFSFLFMWLHPQSMLGRLLDLSYISNSFALLLLALVLVNAAVVLCADKFVFGKVVDLIATIKRKVSPKHRRKRYKELMAASAQSV